MPDSTTDERARSIVTVRLPLQSGATERSVMDYVNLGNCGLRVSRLCLGMMSYGTSAWRPWVLNEPEGRPIIKHALEAGINFFDTADMYSNGVSEEVLGR